VHMDPNLLPNTPQARVANEVLNRVNVERTARGEHPLFLDRTLSAYAQSWAVHLASTHSFDHQNLGTVLVAGGWQEVGENLYGGSGAGAETAGMAHTTLMHSDGHRSNILLPEEQLIGTGAACLNGELIVVEDFATPQGVPMFAHGTPPVNPIASSDQGGAAC